MTLRPSLPFLRPRTRIWFLRLVAFGIVLVAWEIGARTLNSLLFPTPTETFTALLALIVMPSFWEALWLSNQAMILGFLCAAVVGVLVGLLIGRSRTAEKFLNPYLNIMLATPMTALVPIIILALGLGLGARVFAVFVFAVVIIIINTRAGMRTMEPAWVEMARSFGAREWQMWYRVLLPGALPGIVTGLRLGLGRAFTGMVAIELTLVAVGIGRLILDFQSTFEAGSVYATVIVVILEALLLFHGLRALERRIVPWHPKQNVD